MKFVIWGAGLRGKRICYHIGEKNVAAFIDNDAEKKGSLYCNIEVIDFPMYQERFSDLCIVVSTHEEEVTVFLEEHKIAHYFCMSDCPEDFQSPNMRMILKEELQKSVTKEKHYAVYGNTLYSVLLYQWLLEAGVRETPLLVMGEACPELLMRQLRQEWGECVRKDFSGSEEKVDTILVTLDEADERLEKEIPDSLKEKTENVLRYSERIPAYHHSEIEPYKNRYQGKRCFIVATGPSLRKEDLETLAAHGELCISMNMIYKIFSQTDWRPDFFVADDWRMMCDHSECLDYMEHVPCFMGDSYEPFCKEKHGEHVMIYHSGMSYVGSSYDGKKWSCKGFMPFSEDFAQIAYVSGTVTYVAMQLAVYLGCKEIYLLGTDASGLHQSYQKYGHFYEEKKLLATCYSGQVYASYLSARKYAKEHGIRIYNASRGGELEVFERVDFDQLFS